MEETPDKAGTLTSDTFCRGRLRVSQYRDGYRFSIDAVLLADYAAEIPGRTVVEFGTGCGIVSLLMSCRDRDRQFHAVDIQESLADLARINVAENRLTRRMHVLHRDLREISSADFADPVDLVVTNPPYHPVGSGRINPNRQKALARHELEATLGDVMQAARRTLQLSGTLVMIYPAERAVDLFTEMRLAGIEPKRLQFVQSHENETARLVRVRGVKGASPGLAVEAPLVVYREDGSYTDAAARLLED